MILDRYSIREIAGRWDHDISIIRNEIDDDYILKIKSYEIYIDYDRNCRVRFDLDGNAKYKMFKFKISQEKFGEIKKFYCIKNLL